MNPFIFNTVPSIQFGAGKLNELGSLTKSLGVKRALIVTDSGMLTTGIVDEGQAALESAGLVVTIFSEVAADPSEDIVKAAVASARAAQIDSVVGIGGGSSLDVAKLVALLVDGRQQLEDCYGVGNAKGPRLPLVLVPTTAGTGSEVTPISIVTTAADEKMGVVSPVILPDLAVLDPMLTIGLPAPITAATGIDAMVHAIEAYASASPNNNPISKHLARLALSLMGPAIEKAVHDGDDIDARSDMLLGSLLAGQAFANSPVAAVHALAYPLGGHFHIPHGLSNALVLPHVMRFNVVTHPEPYAELAPSLFPELANMPEPKQRAEAFCEKLAGLSKACGLQQTLREMGIPESILPRLASDAMNQQRLLVNNPRKVTEPDALTIYRAAF